MDLAKDKVDLFEERLPQKRRTTIPSIRVRRALTRHRDLVHRLLVCLVMVIGAGLRFYDLGAESYWLDEVTMANVAGASLQALSSDVRQTGRPPVYPLLLHFWMQAFGTSEATARALSASVGAGALGLMYMVGRDRYTFSSILFCP